MMQPSYQQGKWVKGTVLTNNGHRCGFLKSCVDQEDNLFGEMVYEILNFSVGEGSKEPSHGNIKP